MASNKRKAASTETTLVKRSRTGTDEKQPKPRRSLSEAEEAQEAFEDFEEIGTTEVEGNTGQTDPDEQKTFLNGTSSREAHAKQKAERVQRKSAKPNADIILRAKKLWERLRRKSHVPKEERQTLVKELFEIITGRVHDFVFKHDSVRVIQCALKYANPEQKKLIANELKGSYKELAESKYAKFLIAKMVVGGEDGVRDMVVEEFGGNVKRLVRHPEAGWILDDIYRTLCTRAQRGRLLREWYGPEFVLFKNGKDATSAGETEDLKQILEKNPEKRGPIMQHLKEMTNQLVQGKKTGFTMLHDAMLQYALNMKQGSPEATEFWDMLRDDEDGDLFRNLAFTKSGARLVCLALAYGSSKDRRTILKFFKTHIKLLAGDANGHLVLLVAYELIDDTVMSSKQIFSELLSKDLSAQEREQELLGQVHHLTGRIALLWLMNTEPPKWLATAEDLAVMEEIRHIRMETSKKDPEVRRIELVKAISQPLLDLIAAQTEPLMQSSFGCQFVAEVLLGGIGEKQAALEAVADFAFSTSEDNLKALNSPSVGRMLKALVQGGRFDKEAKVIQAIDPPLDFSNLLYKRMAQSGAGTCLSWACGPNSFTVVAMLEASDFAHRDELTEKLKRGREQLSEHEKTNAGCRILLDKSAVQSNSKASKPLTHRKMGSKGKAAK